MVVLGDGEHHNDNATDAIGDFLGDRDRIHSLRLHPHTETNEEAAKGNSAARALIGRAAGEPYRPLKKLDQVCDLTRDEIRRIAADVIQSIAR